MSRLKPETCCRWAKNKAKVRQVQKQLTKGRAQFKGSLVNGTKCYHGGNLQGSGNKRKNKLLFKATDSTSWDEQ